MTKKRKPAAGFRTSPPPCSAARWRRICKSIGRGYENAKPAHVEFIIKHVFTVYGRMCGRMQEQCQKYHLGMAGNHVDQVICDEIDRIHGTPNTSLHRTEPAAGSGTVRGLVGGASR